MNGGRPQRYLIRRAPWLRPLLFLTGLTRDSNSYAAIEDGRLRVRFGWFFNNSFPLSQVESVSLTRWPWYYGLGWRIIPFDTVGAVASLDGVVEVSFRDRQPVSGILPLVRPRFQKIAVSLQEPEAFIMAVQREIQ